MVVDQQREIGICAHEQTAGMGVDVRGLYVYQVDWSRAPHYNHFAQTGNGRVLGPDELSIIHVPGTRVSEAVMSGLMSHVDGSRR